MEPSNASTVPVTRTPSGADWKANSIVTEPAPVIVKLPAGVFMSIDMVSPM